MHLFQKHARYNNLKKDDLKFVLITVPVDPRQLTQCFSGKVNVNCFAFGDQSLLHVHAVIFRCKNNI